ncbi:MAG TPA: phage holin family protein [Acetobacteraceae bacterium]|jgi:xanthine/uracil permease
MSVEQRLSLRELVGGVADDARDLVRGEVALARAEAEQKVNRLTAGVISLFGAMMLAYAGLVIVLIAAAQGLARVLPDWAASLIVGAVVLLIGTVLAGTARKALSPSGMIPERTVRNVEADARVIKESAI